MQHATIVLTTNDFPIPNMTENLLLAWRIVILVFFQLESVSDFQFSDDTKCPQLQFLWKLLNIFIKDWKYIYREKIVFIYVTEHITWPATLYQELTIGLQVLNLQCPSALSWKWATCPVPMPEGGPSEQGWRAPVWTLKVKTESH